VVGDFVIRSGTVDDGPAIASIHVRAWLHAYRGLMPDELLDGLSIERRQAMWTRALSGSAPPEARIFVAEREGRVIGFVNTGPPQNRHDEEAGRPGTAAVFAVYREPDVMGTGVGRALFATAVEDLRTRGHREAFLWVLESNAPTRRFYERAGWRAAGEPKVVDWYGHGIPEIRYRIEL
jgi:GNAT superfamily N-acetyltransferase